MEGAYIQAAKKSGERVLMNNPQVQCKKKAATGGPRRLRVEWSEGEPFCLCAREKGSLPGTQTKIERTYYVKLVIDLPDYCLDRSPVWVCRNCRHRRVDRASTIRSFPRAIPGFSDLR